MRVVSSVACVALSMWWFWRAEHITPNMAGTPLIAASQICGVLFVLIGVVADIGWQLRATTAKKSDLTSPPAEPERKPKVLTPVVPRAKESWPQEEEFFRQALPPSK